MQPTHQSHFTVQQSSKFSQPGPLIFILGVTVQQSQVCSRSYQSSALVSNELCVCAFICMYSKCHYVLAWIRNWQQSERENRERVRDHELPSYCSEHGCIAQGGYGTGCESAERQIDPPSQTL